MARNTVVVRFTGDTSHLERAMGDVDGKLASFGNKVQATGANIARKGAVLTAGITAPLALVGREAFQAAEESEKIGRQTAAVLKSTGGAAGLTAKQIDALAAALSMKAGADDEMIQSGANVLLTFTNLRDEVGKGNDVFSQALGLSLDMSTALGQDMQSSVVQVGKALNDPIKGLTALSRVGVSFTAQQKEQIKNFVEQGDVASAQKVILEELSREFGGSAEAQATSADRARVAMGNLTEQLGTLLLPVVERLSNFVSGLAEKFNALSPGMQQAVVIGAGLLAALGPLVTIIGGLVTVVGALLSPVGLVVLAIAALAAGAVFAYQNFEGFRNVVDGVVQWFTGTALPAIAGFASGIQEKIQALADWWRGIWPQVQEVVSAAFNAIKAVVEAVMGAIGAIWRAVGDDMLRFAGEVWGFIQATVKNGIDAVRNVIEGVLALITGDWKGAWEALKGVVSALFEQLKEVVSLGLAGVKAVLGGLASIIAELATSAFGWAKDVGSAIVRGIVDAIKSAAGSIASAIKNAIPDTIKLPGPLPDIKIPFLQHGVRNFAGGPAVVGEAGPELVFLPRGANVVPNSRIGGTTVHVTVHVHGSVTTERDLVENLGGQIVRTLRLRGVG